MANIKIVVLTNGFIYVGEVAIFFEKRYGSRRPAISGTGHERVRV
jgi:hypothetical protein